MTFRDILGHHSTKSLLSRALAAGTLPPSLILAGPEGVGKREIALTIARTLNCREPVRASAPDASLPLEPCHACNVCERIGRGLHPDVEVLAPGETGSIKIDSVRDALRRIGYRPFEGRRRVIIIDSAEALVPEAQDALLKTLEEPPPSSVLLLVTAVPDQLLPTVRSRCPVVRFSPLAPDDVARWLVADAGLDEADARAVAAVANGRLTVARDIAQSGAGGARAAARRVLERVADARDPRERLQAAAEIAGKGKRTGASERAALTMQLDVLASLIRDLGVLTTGADAGVLVNGDLAPVLEKLARSFDAARIARAYAAVDHALAALTRNASPKLVADWLVLQI